MSPNAVKEEERRELIARQQRALYSYDGSSFSENGAVGDNGQTPRPLTQPSSTQPSSAGGARGPSPLAFDAFGMGQNQGGQTGSSENNGQRSASDHSAQHASGSGPSPIQQPQQQQQQQQQQQPAQQRSRANSTSSPSSNPASFSLFDNAAQQSSRTSTSSPGGSPPRQASKTTTAPIGTGVAPIGTRPQNSQGQAPNAALNKRSTTPLPSPLSYGFNSNENASANERSTSAASNPTSGNQEQGVGLGWGSKSGVWGNKSSLGVQASVWG